jgi:hypothetical protein
MPQGCQVWMNEKELKAIINITDMSITSMDEIVEGLQNGNKKFPKINYSEMLETKVQLEKLMKKFNKQLERINDE